MTEIGPLPAEVLPSGVRARFVDDDNGLSMHVLEAGYEGGDRTTVLLLHGFPEIAYSWREVMPRLAAAGWRAVAPDQRGYGRTTGRPARYDHGNGRRSGRERVLQYVEHSGAVVILKKNTH